LAGCNSNDDDGTAAAAPAATTTPVTITPSLGKILNAKVIARNATTGVEIGSGNTGNTGIAKFDVTKTTAPVVFEVQGSETAKYVDESKLSATNNGETAFGATQKIRVAVPALTANIGVSTLTELAYQTALKTAGNNEKLISAETATKANDEIRDKLAPELKLTSTSITAAPFVIGSFADLANITNTPEGKYALKLAALAKLISAEDATPALTALNKLASDIADGEFNGKVGTAPLGTYTTNADLTDKIKANLNSTIAAGNLLGLNINVNGFNPVFGGIVITVTNPTGGGAIPTGNYNLAITTTVSGFSTTVNVPSIPKPTTKAEFCAAEDVIGALDDAGGSFTITSCSFSGSVGDISATINSSGFNLSYNIHYVYTAM
jgi:hypothetical protein